MSNPIANRLALAELAAALDFLDKDVKELPEVRDKDGFLVNDPKDRRLALVKQKVMAAGDIVALMDKAEEEFFKVVLDALKVKYAQQLQFLEPQPEVAEGPMGFGAILEERKKAG